MSARSSVIALSLICSMGSVAHAATNDGITYKWVDEKGVTHYGDRIPAQYSSKESKVLNEQGVEVRQNHAQKSPEQMEEEARLREAAVRKQQHDTFLLTTYPSVKDIENLRDERLEQIKGQRRAAEAYIETVHSRLAALQTRAMGFKPYSDRPNARRMPDDLAEDLVRTLNEMRTQTTALAAKDAEESALRAQFQTDIDRYQELRATTRNR